MYSAARKETGAFRYFQCFTDSFPGKLLNGVQLCAKIDIYSVTLANVPVWVNVSDEVDFKLYLQPLKGLFKYESPWFSHFSIPGEAWLFMGGHDCVHQYRIHDFPLNRIELLHVYD
jgi:hypothetical protein